MGSPYPPELHRQETFLTRQKHENARSCCYHAEMAVRRVAREQCASPRSRVGLPELRSTHDLRSSTKRLPLPSNRGSEPSGTQRTSTLSPNRTCSSLAILAGWLRRSSTSTCSSSIAAA